MSAVEEESSYNWLALSIWQYIILAITDYCYFLTLEKMLILLLALL